MKRLHLYILKTYLGPMIMTFFIVMFILVMQFMWRYLDDLVGKGLDFMVIAELMLYASAGLMPMAFPLATLLASLMTMGTLGEHNELMAMKASGISLPRILRPLLWLNILVSIFAFVVSDSIAPVATLKMRALIYSVQRKRPDLVIRPGVFYTDLGSYAIRVAEKDKNTSRMTDVMIYDHSQEKGNVSVTRADSGYIRFTSNQSHMIIELYNGILYEETDDEALTRYESEKRTYGARQTHFKHERLIQRLDGFGFERTDEALFRETYHVMNTRQLKGASDTLAWENSVRIKDFYETTCNARFLRPGVPGQDSLQVEDTINPANLWNGLSEYEQETLLHETIVDLQTLKSEAQSFNEDYRYWQRHRMRHDIELHRKFSLAVACLLFFLIGAPLGAIIRKGGLGMPVVISVLFFVAYYIISVTGEKFAKELIYSATKGMWLSTFILIPIALFLIYKATTDSALFRADWYQAKWQNIQALIKARKNAITEKGTNG